jgi:hypothetical protein
MLLGGNFDATLDIHRASDYRQAGSQIKFATGLDGKVKVGILRHCQ